MQENPVIYDWVPNSGGIHWRAARRVAGAAAGGAQRGVGGGGTFNLYLGSSVRAGLP